MDVRGQNFQGALGAGQALAFGGDAGLSRDAAGVVDVGNGAPGDRSGTLQASYGGFASGVITSSKPVLTLTQTWNNAAIAFTGILVTITNSGSLASSNLLDLQVGGLSKFHVAVDGTATSGNSFVATGAITAFGNFRQQTLAAGYLFNDDTGIWRDSAGVFDFGNGVSKDKSGTLQFANAIASGYIATGSTTVASLPSASAAGAGARHFVTDANSTSFMTVAAGGGSNKVPVVSDGTTWKIG